MAATWADELSDVPTEAILKLHGRVMKARKAPYCPNVGDYRAAWNNWDYWAELNAREEPNDFKALPEAMGSRKIPRFVQLFQQCGPVLCKCDDPAQMMTVRELMELGRDVHYHGLDYNGCSDASMTASGLPRYWVCATGKCDWCVDANGLDEVLPPKRQRDGEGFSAISAVIDSLCAAPRVSTTPAEPTDAPDLSDDELLQALAAIGFPVEKRGRERSLEFGRYLVRQLGVEGLNARDAITLWPEFKAAQHEAVRA